MSFLVAKRVSGKGGLIEILSAVEEVLRREVVVEADDLETAKEALEKAYRKEEIILGAEDVVPDALTGESKTIMTADWYDQETVQAMKTDLTA